MNNLSLDELLKLASHYENCYRFYYAQQTVTYSTDNENKIKYFNLKLKSLYDFISLKYLSMEVNNEIKYRN